MLLDVIISGEDQGGGRTSESQQGKPAFSHLTGFISTKKEMVFVRTVERQIKMI